MGENDYNSNGDERYDIFEELPSEREEIPTWPDPAQFDHSSESSRTGRAASAARRLVRSGTLKT